MSPSGESLAYTGGTTHIPVPHANDTAYRRTHTPAKPKPSGLDWDALKQTCDVCGQKASDVLDGTCGRCRKGITEAHDAAAKPERVVTPYADTYQVLDEHDVAARFDAPSGGPSLQADLDELEQTDPLVADAAASFDDMVQRITRPEDHVKALPRHVRAKVRQTSPDDLHITLRGPGLAHRQTEIAALLGDLLAALNTQTPGAGVNATDHAPLPMVGPKAVKDTGLTFLDPDRPAPAPAPHTSGTEVAPEVNSPPTSVDDCPSSVPEPHTSGGGDRKGKPAPSPGFTTFQRPTKRTRLDPEATTRIIRLYQDERRSILDLAAEYRVARLTISTLLRDHGVTIRPLGKPITEADVDRMVELYTAGGKGLPVVAKTVGVSKARTREALLARGVQLREAHGPSIKAATRARTTDVRAWAIEQGLLTPEQTRGRFPQAVRDAYAAAHPTHTEEEHTTA